VYKYPKLYRAGPKHYYFNMETFWVWMAYAGWHGVICFFLPVFVRKGWFLGIILFRVFQTQMIPQESLKIIGGFPLSASL